MAKSRLHQLSELGQSVWIDFLSRHMLQSGELARMMEEDAVVGVTSNPTIFQKAISEGDLYDDQLREVLAEEDDAKEVFLRLAVKDVQDACDLLRKVWDGGGGQDGYVSIEVDPNLAYDTEGTIAEAQRLHELVDRPNCFVKIPGDRARAAGDRGDDRPRTLDQRDADLLAAALLRGRRGVPARARAARRERRRSRPGGLGGELLRLAGGHGGRQAARGASARPDELKGKLAVANAKLAYQRYKELHSGERWEALAAKGARKQRCLWASTSTKNPAYRDVMYVEELIGPETVDTMPEETIRAFQDHGEVALTLERDLDEARAFSTGSRTPGWTTTTWSPSLEREGVEKFSDSFRELLDGVRSKRGELVSA